MHFNIEDLEIKSITPLYYKQNLELLNTIIKESHYSARIKEISNDQSQEFMDYILNFLNSTYLIALYDEMIIGHIFALPQVEELIGHIVNIGYNVKSEYKDKGVGSMLMEHLIIEANKKGNVKIMIAEVVLDNRASKNLVKKYNFHLFGKISRAL